MPRKATLTPDLRAKWVVQLIRDRIELYGHSPRIAEITAEHFKCHIHTAEAAVKRAYEMIKAELSEFKPNISEFLIEVHLKTIAKGFREDGRLVTPAATALAKLVGADAADKVHVTGDQSHSITIDERNLVKALKLTNAQRLAEIDKLRGELGVPGSGPVQTVGGGQNVATAQTGPVFNPSSPEQPEPEEFAPYPASPTAEEIPEPEPDPQDDELTFSPLPDDEEDDDDDED